MEVIISDFHDHPSCPHGPCLLFERYSAHGTKTGRRFYACSACRDRSECSFFHWADEKMSEETKKAWAKIISEKKPPYSHEEYLKKLDSFRKLPINQKKYCNSCSLLIINDVAKHSNHDVVNVTSDDKLFHPSQLFKVHKNKKVEAQYYFSESTVTFVVTLLQNLGFSNIICIGAPKIHEYIIGKKLKDISSVLLDLDYRYMQFFSLKQFFHYNMFNNHFFEGESSKNLFKTTLKEEKTAIIIDPPFGGLVDAISLSLKTINNWWQEETGLKKQIPILWIFPFFHEHRILKNLPDMKMMDYKVEYRNHKKFIKNGCKSSPVRIFTNIEASSFILPVEKGYKFCKICKRYVCAENKHCSKCNACTTKHGKTYHHCDKCKQCVKPSYIHCSVCNKCNLPSESSNICKKCESGDAGEENSLERCFKCNGVGHRKRTCPEGIVGHAKKRKFSKKM